MAQWYMAWEKTLLLFIQNVVRRPWLTPIMKGITMLGDKGIFWILLTLVLLAIPKTRKAGWYSLIALVGSVICNNLLLKNLLGRTRPYEVITELKLLVKAADDFSFPSGHSGASFASAVALCHALPRKYSVPLVVLAALIAFSRLYVGIHYPTDVLFGIADGIVLGLLARPVGDRLWEKLPDKLRK